MNRQTVTDFLTSYLSVNEIDDFSYNGLQFEGCSDVNCIGFAVDAGLGTFKQAAEAGVDLLVVHHGLFWKKVNPVITGVHKERVKILFDNDMSLYGVHLPLDMHDMVGNNSGIVKLLGGEVVDRFSDYGRWKIGAIGELNENATVEQVADKLSEKLNCKIRSINIGNVPVKRIAVISGACSRTDLYAAVEKGADLLITGEPMELYHDAYDYGISVIFAGHHASETVGISLLRDRVAEEFPELETLYLSHPTNL